MRRTSFIATALLALSLTPALQAQYGAQDRYRNDSRRSDRTEAIAREIEQVSTTIRREYERNNRRPDRSEARVLQGLRELDARADQFYNQVDYRSANRRRAGDEFARLESSFFDLSESLRYISARPYVDRGMDRIADLMSDLSRYYGHDNRADRYRRNGGWHDRYGRDDDRDGRYGRDYRDDRDRDDAYRTRPPAF